MWSRKAVLAIRTAITGITSRLTTIENAGYQTASDVSAAIASAVGDLTELEYTVVQSLPASGTKGVIYLVPHQHGTRDIYDEYIWVNNAFEKIGSTDVDLSGYLKDTDISAWAKASTKPTYTASEVGALPDSTAIPSKTSQLTNDSGYITSVPVTSVNGKTGAVNLNASDVGALPSSIAIPSKTSDLTNDSGYITGYTETDPTVPSWAKQSTKPSYTAAEVGALPNTTQIPSKTSDLVNDTGFITGYTETDPTVPAWAKTPSKPTYTASEVGALSDSTVIPGASSATPSMDGTGAAGSSADYARADHVHPSDTAKQDALTAEQMAAVNSGITANNLAVNDASVLCTVTPIEPTLSAGANYATYGGCWYYKIGRRVTVHIGVSGLTTGEDTTLWTLPAGYRPRSSIGWVGNAGGIGSYGRFRITSAGVVRAYSAAQYALGEISFDAFS